MTEDQVSTGLLTYVVFLFSTTCHEASHAYVAKRGGDPTAAQGGQVSLNPLPHVRREPFGMVVLPLLSLLTSGQMIGWASAPYNPYWQQQYPRRAAWMALAGPAANFVLVAIAGALLRLGIMTGTFHASGWMHGVGEILSVCFTLNLLLGIFNLLPVPPLDGFNALGLLLPSNSGIRVEQIRMKLRQFSLIGLLIGWQAINFIYPPVLSFASSLVTAGLRLAPR